MTPDERLDVYQRLIDVCRSTAFSMSDFTAAMNRITEQLRHGGDWHSVDEAPGMTLEDLIGPDR